MLSASRKSREESCARHPDLFECTCRVNDVLTCVHIEHDPSTGEVWSVTSTIGAESACAELLLYVSRLIEEEIGSNERGPGTDSFSRIGAIRWIEVLPANIS